MAKARPASCNANLSTRRGRFTDPASWGSNRAETNSRKRMIPRRSARMNNATSAGIKSSPQSHCGAPKLMRSTRFPPEGQPISAISFSWQFLPDRLRQQNLGDQQTATAHQAKREEIAILLVLFHAHGRFFQFVDVAIDLFQRFGIRRPEKLAVRNFRDFPQTPFVKFNTLVFIKHVAQGIR